ncbi:MAG: hypothetical protein ACI9O0_000067 [Paracoccaceae bacterium]|jgi:hypothetical protein
MHKVFILGLLSLTALAACADTDIEQKGLGFSDYDSYLRDSAARAQAESVVARAEVVTLVQKQPELNQSAATVYMTAMPTAALTNISENGAPLNATAFGYGAREAAAVQTAMGTLPVAQSSVGFSTDRLTSVLDRVETTALVGNALLDGLDPVARYALKTTHDMGQALYPRGAVALLDRVIACDIYVGPEEAQLAFLTAGGPQKDPRGLDGDGDGFACTWDPRPYRMALR